MPETHEARTISPDPRHAAGKPPGGARYGFVDLLRGLALVVMIETHVVNAYLPAGLRQGPFFYWLVFLNGLVAPSFLFASGFSLVLQGRRHWDAWLRFQPPFWKHLRRLGFILMLGYIIHLQYFRLSSYLASQDPEVWKRTLQVDILQCIVVSLIVVNLLILLVRTRSRLTYAAAALGFCFTLATPFIWAQDFTGRLPLGLALFLNPGGISLFPVFPWTTFLLAGSSACCFFVAAVEGETVPRFMRWLATAGAGLICTGLVGRIVPFSLPGYQDFYLTSPLYVAIRLGCVLLLLAALWSIERRGIWFPRGILVAGQESLLVYGLHLLVIFGLLRNKRVGPILGMQMGYTGCLILSMLLVLSMLWLAQHWHEFKRQHSLLVWRTQTTAAIVAILIFLVR